MRNRLCYLRNYKAVCFNFLKTKSARALWTSGAKHLNMYSALGAGKCRWKRLQRDSRSFGNKEYLWFMVHESRLMVCLRLTVNVS